MKSFITGDLHCQ